MESIQETKQTYFGQNCHKLTKWLNFNINSKNNKYVNDLIKTGEIALETFENYYEKVNRTDYDTEEEYNKALDNLQPLIIYEWYLVSDKAYELFKKFDYPVIQYKGQNIWGRTNFTPHLYMDYYYEIDKMKILIDDYHMNY
jgi:hypothetical protein